MRGVVASLLARSLRLPESACAVRLSWRRLCVPAADDVSLMPPERPPRELPDPPPTPQWTYKGPRADEDPAPLFFSPRVQQLMVSLTGKDYDRVFKTKKLGKALKPPRYHFMTQEQYQQLLAKYDAMAVTLLRPPPYLRPQEQVEQVLSDDPEIKGLTKHKYVFTDISASISNKDRLIVVRDPDGTLRRATGDERERMNQNYFPNPFKKHYLPHMFHGSYFKDLMDRREYEFVLERACHQFDPDHPGFIEVSRTVYDTIDDKGEHLILKHTRHFGALMFHLCWVNRIDNALVLFLRIGSVQDAVDLVRLFYELQPSKSPSVDYEENPLGFLEEFVEAHAFQRDLLKELVNVIRNQVTEERETG